MLEDHGNLAADGRGILRRGGIKAQDADGAGAGHEQRVQHLGQRGLSRSVAAEDAYVLPGVDRKGYPGQRLCGGTGV